MLPRTLSELNRNAPHPENMLAIAVTPLPKPLAIFPSCPMIPPKTLISQLAIPVKKFDRLVPMLPSPKNVPIVFRTVTIIPAIKPNAIRSS